jgi:hypothetical protein
MRAATVALLLLLAACESDPSTVTPPSGSPLPVITSATPTPSATRAAPILQLSGDDLGVTRIGAPKLQATAAVSKVLGRVDTSPGPTRCIGSSTEARWTDLTLSFDAAGKLNGWFVTTAKLSTPSGVRVGTTVAQLKRIYGDKLTFYPANTENPPTYSVRQVQMVGYLSNATDSARVTSFANRACTGP